MDTFVSEPSRSVSTTLSPITLTSVPLANSATSPTKLDSSVLAESISLVATMQPMESSLPMVSACVLTPALLSDIHLCGELST